MREIPGPNPHEYGIVSLLEKTKKPDLLTLLKTLLPKKIAKNRRHQTSGARLPTENEFLVELETQHKQEAKEKIKTEFFRDIDRKAKEKQLRARVENEMERRNLSLYERRKRFTIHYLVCVFFSGFVV